MIDGDWIFYDATLELLNASDLLGLLLHREVLVDDTNAALLSERNGKTCFGHGIHGR